MLDSPMLVDQNMVCGSNKDQRDHFPRIHQICIPTFPFDPPMLRGTYFVIYHTIRLRVLLTTKVLVSINNKIMAMS